MSLQETWREGIQRLAYVYIEEYRKDKQYVQVLKNTQVPMEILRLVYNQLVNEGEIKPIEDLPLMEKRMLAAEAGECNDLKQICTCLYVMKKILNV